MILTTATAHPLVQDPFFDAQPEGQPLVQHIIGLHRDT